MALCGWPRAKELLGVQVPRPIVVKAAEGVPDLVRSEEMNACGMSHDANRAVNLRASVAGESPENQHGTVPNSLDILRLMKPDEN